MTNQYIEELQIKCTGSGQKARELSGGNQQKVCLAKAFALEPRFLFVSEPTRGIDVGAKALVLEALKKFNRESGVTVVMICARSATASPSSPAAGSPGYCLLTIPPRSSVCSWSAR